MKKKIIIIAFGMLILSSFGIAAYAVLERADTTTDHDLDKLIQDSICKGQYSRHKDFAHPQFHSPSRADRIISSRRGLHGSDHLIAIR
ncbi:MAG: hypothetical protein AAGL97_08390 [Pseudomonadota bacterium]